MDAVELDFEGGKAGAFAFARFEVEQEFVAVVLDVAQLVKFCRIALVDDAAVFEPDGGFGHHGGFEGFGDGQGFGENGFEGFQQAAALGGQFDFRQGKQAVAQGGEVARTGVADGDAGGDAFDVCDVFQTALQGFVLRTQRGNGFLAGADVGAAA